jgi:methylated-DNA-[protein]-cysteine S-methyltransferase
MTSGTIHYATLESPCGPLLVAGGSAGLTRVSFLSGTHPLTPELLWERNEAALAEASRQLRSYFAGKLRDFSLPLAPRGTEFQQAVWKALQAIPYGRTITYGELARRVGKPNAARAVGAANGANPLPVIVPCHRVIGADGSLTGYGEGLPIKRALLELESRVAGAQERLFK